MGRHVEQIVLHGLCSNAFPPLFCYAIGYLKPAVSPSFIALLFAITFSYKTFLFVQ